MNKRCFICEKELGGDELDTPNFANPKRRKTAVCDECYYDAVTTMCPYCGEVRNREWEMARFCIVDEEINGVEPGVWQIKQRGWHRQYWDQVPDSLCWQDAHKRIADVPANWKRQAKDREWHPICDECGKKIAEAV